MNPKTRLITRLAVLFLFTASACNMPRGSGDKTPTPDVTQAYQTVQARLTEAAGVVTPQPTATSSEPSPTPPTYATPTGGVPTFTTNTPTTGAPPTAVSRCNLAEPGSPIDVTIPDDTQMAPGHAFTKVWRLRNAGTCTWSRNYSIAVFSGEPMNAPNSVPLPKAVAPNETVDISVDLVAPNRAGSYQGNWKLRDEAGAWFGIGPGGASPFWVRIVVTGSGTAVPPTATTGAGTPHPTDTSAPENPPVLVSGGNTLNANDRLNLDNNLLNLGGEDVALEPDAQDRLIFKTLGGAGMVGFGGTRPTYATCQAANPGPTSTRAANLPSGAFVCYRTNDGNYGWLRVVNFNAKAGTLIVEINTWTNP